MSLSLPRHNNPGGILGRKPATSVKRLAPMLVTTPTLGAYRSSPLFVEPLDTAKRVDALHGRMMSTRGPCRPRRVEYLKALEAFEIAQKMHPHHPKAMYNAGLAHWHLGHSQLTATKFTAVLAADPSHAKAIYALHVLHTQFHVSVS
ncbi:hypothetical protein DYB26_012865 [Aphanomyces astaci]|uniref:Uncharacterized protein n=1 Tax=Aphanomyces astaci TaxID=112090 RepID=A0A418FV24_APHAT|nr:hypothetical protein DYB26_012865 [Aphanomyces astaci]